MRISPFTFSGPTRNDFSHFAIVHDSLVAKYRSFAVTISATDSGSWRLGGGLMEIRPSSIVQDAPHPIKSTLS